MCVTVDYVRVERKELDTFVELAKAHVSQKLGGAYSTGQDCCGIITDRHLQRLVRLLDEAKTAGAKIVDLESNTSVDPKTRRMPLVLVVDPSKDLAITREEIFGPILPVIPYDALEQAVAEVNADERPLGLYVFGKDEKDIDYVLKNTKSGGAAVNACAVQAALPSLGFGGTGNSGMGRHHGFEGFREFSNPKGIVRRGTAPDLLAALCTSPLPFPLALAFSPTWRSRGGGLTKRDQTLLMLLLLRSRTMRSRRPGCSAPPPFL